MRKFATILSALLLLVLPFGALAADESPKGTTGDNQGKNGPFVWSLMGVSNDGATTMIALRVDPATKELMVKATTSGSSTVSGTVTVVQSTVTNLKAEVQGTTGTGLVPTGKPIRVAGYDSANGVIEDIAVDGAGTVFVKYDPAFYSGAVTFTATGNSAVVTLSAPVKFFTATQKGTGAAATTSQPNIQISMNGIVWTNMIALNTDEEVRYGTSLALYLRVNMATLTLGPATNVVVSYLASE
jgi:hypothetical protein